MAIVPPHCSKIMWNSGRIAIRPYGGSAKNFKIPLDKIHRGVIY